MKAIQEVNSGKLYVQEAEMKENEKKITEQKRKLDELSMVLEKNVRSKSSHHHQHGYTSQHYGYHSNHLNKYNYNSYHMAPHCNGHHYGNTNYNHIPRDRENSSRINKYNNCDKKYFK